LAFFAIHGSPLFSITSPSYTWAEVPKKNLPDTVKGGNIGETKWPISS
jgi:hypothetical protein